MDKESPARCTGLTFESQHFRQVCALLDQDGPRLDGVWHLGSSWCLECHIVRQQLARAVRCFRWTQSLQLVVLQAAFLMSSFVAATLTCLFSCAFRNARITYPAM